MKYYEDIINENIADSGFAMHLTVDGKVSVIQNTKKILTQHMDDIVFSQNRGDDMRITCIAMTCEYDLKVNRYNAASAFEAWRKYKALIRTP